MLGFVWTEKTTDVLQMIRGRMPWNGAPWAEVTFLAIRNGPIPVGGFRGRGPPRQYLRVFRREPPPLWGIVLLADSNEVEPDVGEMTTDATIRDIRLTK